MWEVLRRTAHALRLRGPLETDSTARMLHVLVLALTIWFGFWSIVLLPYGNTSAKLPFILLAELGPVTSLVLLRFGSFRAAAWMYLAGTWVWATVLVAVSGGIRSPDQIIYVSLPILATWVLGFRAALWTVGACLASDLAFACIEYGGVNLARVLPLTPLGIWATMLQVILIGAVPVAQILRTLQDTLAKSRRAEQELQVYREHLEQLVQQRTAEVVEARDQALAANRAKSAFLANMSHELRTPLNAILGFSAMVRADAALSDKHRKDLAIVGSSGEHLLRLIDSVLDMAKIESGGMDVENAAVDLYGLLNDMATMLQERARTKNLTLLLEIHPQTPRFIRCDSGKLRQILTNLLGNAVKYTEEGGIVLRAGAKPGESPKDLTLILDVEDTGIGIAAEDQARIFDPFVQAGGKRAIKGTGLGLAICRHFVRLLGGTIQLESTPGRGSRFCVEIPVQTAEASEAIVESPVVQLVIGLEPGQTDYRVLIVEDQKENWLLLERLLQTVGFQVRVVNDGRQAIEAFEKWRPHFIWMDIRLPVLSGSEATARIRELKGGTEVKIVAVTASAFSSQREELLKAGFDDFLRKPYRLQEIFDCLARHLGVRYRYGAGEQAAAGDLSGTLRPEDLAALPATLRDELKSAVINLDAEQIALVAGQISRQNAALGSVLAGLASQLSFTPILKALESCERGVLKAGH